MTIEDLEFAIDQYREQTEVVTADLKELDRRKAVMEAAFREIDQSLAKNPALCLLRN